MTDQQIKKSIFGTTYKFFNKKDKKYYVVTSTRDYTSVFDLLSKRLEQSILDENLELVEEINL